MKQSESTNTSTIMSAVTSSDTASTMSSVDTFIKFFTELNKGEELDVMINNYKPTNKLTMNDFTYIMKYVSVLQNTHETKKSTTLDVSYGFADYQQYRLSIHGVDKINKMMKMVYHRNNHIIFGMWLQQEQYDDDMEVIKKMRTANVHDWDERDIRFRVSSEQKVPAKEKDNLKTINQQEMNKIFFRFKERLSVTLIDDAFIKVVLDCTIVRSNKNITRLGTCPREFEVELDIQKKKPTDGKPYIKPIMMHIDNIKKTLQQSHIIIDNQNIIDVKNEYLTCMHGSTNKQNIYAMQPVSLETQHLIKKLPNHYTITDKADGEYQVLMIHDTHVYLMSNNMVVRDTGIVVNKKYNKTILEGEYIYVNQEKKFAYLAFDALYYCGKDIRNTSILYDRLQCVNDVMLNCFKSKRKLQKYTGEYKVDAIQSFQSMEMQSYFDNLRNRIKESKDIAFVDKYFMFPTGAIPNEIYLYCKLMWEQYTTENVPYELDGLTCTPLDQRYTNKRTEIKRPIYKWKPSNMNSIDFWIEFQKDKSGEVITYFDKTDPITNGQPYRICTLHCGTGSPEQPVPFMPDQQLDQVYLAVVDDVVRDQNGIVINDKTVVEFYYNHQMSHKKHAWVPMRTRHDKTDSVRRYKKKFGNNEHVAKMIWRSIQNNVQMDDIVELAGNNYKEVALRMEENLSKDIMSIDRNQDAYYQNNDKMSSQMRQWHNYIKSHLIQTYCSKRKVNGKLYSMRVLDMGVGIGGDNSKYYQARVRYMVGIDKDPYGLRQSLRGAVPRYKQLKANNTGVPDMRYAVADASLSLDLETQEANVELAPEDREVLSKYFGKTKKSKGTKFDVICSMFSIHYLFKNQESLDTLCENINKYLDTNGYIIITTFDSDRVRALLGDDSQFTEEYTTEEGEKKIFYDIIRKYEPTIKNFKQPGIAVDIMNSWISDNHVTEYLVNKDHIIETFSQKCGLKCIETELFENFYHTTNEFFKNVVDTEDNPKNKKYIANVKAYLDSDTVLTNKFKKYSNLSRFYVFQK